MLDLQPEHSYTGPAFRPTRDGSPCFSGFIRPLTSGPEAPGIVPGLTRASEDTVMATGTIARLLIDKGFGFIRDEGGIEHFFHRSSVRGAVFELLREGQRVEFSAEDSTKGPRAGDVRLIEG